MLGDADTKTVPVLVGASLHAPISDRTAASTYASSRFERSLVADPEDGFVSGSSISDGKGGATETTAAVDVSEPGLLRVTTGIDSHPNGGVAGKILVDGIPRDEWALNWVKMPPGNHVVSFSDMADLGTPAPVAVDLLPGEVVEIYAVYRAYGWLRIVTDPPVPGTIYVDGVPANDWAVWRAAAPGTYTISFGAVEGFTPPAPQTVTVYREQLTTVVGWARTCSMESPADPIRRRLAYCALQQAKPLIRPPACPLQSA